MARLFKAEEYNARREEILDKGLSLVYDKGYEQMTIQDILDGLGISRGAFYHYFDSKQALLEALIERMGSQAEQPLQLIVLDQHLTALQKFSRFFEISGGLKSRPKELAISLMNLWHSDESALVRQKMIQYARQHTPGLLEPVILQGIREKVFTAPFPEETSFIITSIALSLADAILELRLAPGPAPLPKLARLLEAYAGSVERILGAAAGSLKFSTAQDFKEW